MVLTRPWPTCWGLILLQPLVRKLRTFLYCSHHHPPIKTLGPLPPSKPPPRHQLAGRELPLDKTWVVAQHSKSGLAAATAVEGQAAAPATDPPAEEAVVVGHQVVQGPGLQVQWEADHLVQGLTWAELQTRTELPM